MATLVFGLLVVAVAAATPATSAATNPQRLGYDFVVSEDGTYIWYNDERAVIKDRTLIAGFVESDAYTGITSVDLATGRRLSQNIRLRGWGYEFNDPKADDHNNPAILPMSNGRIGVFFTGHEYNSAKGTVWRVSEPGIPTSLDDFGPESTAGFSGSVTYSNVYQLSGEGGKIYAFFRGNAKDTYFRTFDANGKSPTDAVQLVGGSNWQVRPYVKYTSNGVDRIDMFLTDGHPTHSRVSLYHAYYKGGKLYKSNGDLVPNPDGGPYELENMTKVYDRAVFTGEENPWNHEIKLGADGNPVVVYSRQVDPYNLDYGYAVYKPSTEEWVHTKVADAGDSMIPTNATDPYDGKPVGSTIQQDYAGGIAINPLNVNEVFISTNVNPITEKATAEFEIYRGLLANGKFSWTAITQDSTESNYRPFVPTGAKASDQVVIWFAGKYDAFVNQNLGTGADLHFYKGFETKIVGRYLNRGFEQTTDNYKIDFNGPHAITAEGYLPLGGAGNSSLVTERASISLANANGERERAGVAGDVLSDFGFSYEDLDVAITDLNPGSYEFSLTNYDLANDQNVAIQLFPTGSQPVTVVASHSQTDPKPAKFTAKIEADTDYTLRIKRLGNRATVVNGLEITRLDGPVTPTPTPGGVVASQSSTYGNEAVASRAIDGNTSGKWNEGSVASTNRESQPWWQVDLGESSPVGDVVVWNRTDCCAERLSDFYVLASDQPFKSDSLSTLLSDPNVMSMRVGPSPNPSATVNFAGKRARYVRVQLNGTNHLSLAEVEVKKPSAGGMVASQSSTYGDVAVASRAIDGNASGKWSDGSIASTNRESQPWWQVDLGESSQVGDVVVSNRTDCCSERLSDFYVLVSDQPFKSGSLSALLSDPNVTYKRIASSPNPRATVNFAGKRARYVRVQLNGTNYLSLAEVEVKKSSAGGIVASQSSTYGGYAVASRAIDGNTNGNWADGSVASTDQEKNPWWQVDLGRQQFLDKVEISNRTDCCSQRLSDFYILTSREPFSSNDLATLLDDPKVTARRIQEQPGKASSYNLFGDNARYVRIQLNGSGYLSLAEVKVIELLT